MTGRDRSTLTTGVRIGQPTIEAGMIPPPKQARPSERRCGYCGTSYSKVMLERMTSCRNCGAPMHQWHDTGHPDSTEVMEIRGDRAG